MSLEPIELQPRDEADHRKDGPGIVGDDSYLRPADSS